METIIGVIGLGYVGLPLANEFSKKYNVIGYDINEKRVNEINNYYDSTLEIDSNELKKNIKKEPNNNGLHCVSELNSLEKCNFFIITVPTPVDKNNNPDMTALKNASMSVGTILKKSDIVVYESTVYPGATEDFCIPILEEHSKLKFNKDFFVGYSPERINPGDKKHTVGKILKVTSGSNPHVAKKIDNIYKSVISAGTFLASSIKVAEAAKVIENTQRDINIAFVNELSRVFDKMNIETSEVLEAASTKWNFLNFKPGLVGGHCIGVDPYYLANESIRLGYKPKIILSGRKMNDTMHVFIVNKILRLIKNKTLDKLNCLVLGLTFKENCPDTRNSKVFDLVEELNKNKIKTHIYDPWVNNKDFSYLELKEKENLYDIKYDIVILAVSHEEFLSINYRKITKEDHIIFDIKNFLGKKATHKL